MKAKITINKTELLKIAIRLGASASVGSVVGSILRSNMPFGMGWKQKIVRRVGTFVIVGMAEDRADKYVNDTLDKVFDLFKVKVEEPKEEVSKEPTE